MGGGGGVEERMRLSFRLVHRAFFIRPRAFLLYKRFSNARTSSNRAFFFRLLGGMYDFGVVHTPVNVSVPSSTSSCSCWDCRLQVAAS